VLWLRGEHDIMTKVSVVVGIARAAQRDDMPLLVDLSAVTFMDASTIGAIVGSRNRLLSRGKLLELRGPSPRALRVLEVCGLADLVRQESVHAAGRSTALETWVDVLPIALTSRSDHAQARGTARVVTGRPSPALADVESAGP
jgi:anti-sigma B factor antagonist